MSDSTANLDQVSQSAVQRETTINEINDAASPSTIYGRHASACAGLTWGYYGGRISGTLVANGTLAMTASNTNYVVAHRTTGVASASTANTNWNNTTTYGRCYLIVAGASALTSWEDHREGTGGIFDTAAGVGAGTVTSVDATQGVETVSGSAITTTGTVRGSIVVNAQTGTTYTVLTGDRGKLVTHTNGSAIAVTLPQAGGTFPANWFYWTQNRGAGTVTITPTTSTIDGAATLALTTGQGALIVSDGTNYFTSRGIGNAPAGSSGQVQFNNGSVFGADARLAFDSTNKILTGQFAIDSNAINAQTGTTYTLVASDNGKVVTLSNASAITVTVPSGLGAGFACLLVQIGAGQVTFSASGTTINSYLSAVSIAGQHAAAQLVAYTSNVFNLSGNLA
jgi:hypothetical protein